MNALSRILLVTIALGVGCASPARPPSELPSDADYPGLLRSPRALGANVMWQQSVTAAWEERRESFDAAVQVVDETMLVVGLSPLGQPGFVLRLERDRIDVQNDSGMDVPVPARFVLLDVQRAFFPWFDAAPPAPDAERSLERDGERVHERWSAGRLAERRFERLDAQPPGEIRVTYEWERAEWIAPTRAVLANGWFGYSLTVQTHAETRVERPAALAR